MAGKKQCFKKANFVCNFFVTINESTIAHYTLFANMTNRGTKLFFRRIKYCWRKRDERVAVHCSLFTVNFSAADDFFFDEKVLCVCRRGRHPDANPAYGVWWKTCSRNMANTFYRLFAVRCSFVLLCSFVAPHLATLFFYHSKYVNPCDLLHGTPHSGFHNRP